MSLSPQLRAVEVEFDEAQTWAHRLVDGLSEQDWLRRSDPNRWSIGEQILHLNLTSRAYLPRLRAGLAQARERGLRSKGRYRRDFMGWFLGRMTEPPVRVKVKTKPQFVPQNPQAKEEAMRDFDALQDELRAFLREANGWAIDRVDFVSPFDPRIKYNLYSSLRVTVAHQRHHLWLGDHVAEALGLKAA
ncbi:MAG TPA: DinB family protein [Thermoanaerobaculia bacterium]